MKTSQSRASFTTLRKTRGEATLAQIEARFGSRVAEIMRACTDSMNESRPPWKEWKERYLDKLQNSEPGVALVTTCDKLHNLKCIAND